MDYDKKEFKRKEYMQENNTIGDALVHFTNVAAKLLIGAAIICIIGIALLAISGI